MDLPQGFLNFAARCFNETPLVTGTAERLLHHMMFVIGNGYYYNRNNVYYSFYHFRNRDDADVNILTMEEITPKIKEIIIQDRINQDLQLRECLKMVTGVDYLVKEPDRNWKQATSDMFTVESMYNELISEKDPRLSFSQDSFYGILSSFDKDTNPCIIYLAHNICAAWVMYISNGLKQNTCKIALTQDDTGSYTKTQLIELDILREKFKRILNEHE